MQDGNFSWVDFFQAGLASSIDGVGSGWQRSDGAGCQLRGLIPSPSLPPSPAPFLPQPYILTVDKTLQSAALGFLCLQPTAAHAVSSRENQFCKFSCQLFHFSTLNFSCQLFPAHVNWVLLPAGEGRVQSAAATAASTSVSQCFVSTVYFSRQLTLP